MSKRTATNVVAWSMNQWLQIVALLKQLAQLPSLTDSASVRDWVRHLVELAMKLEDRLPEPVARAVDLLAEIAASDAVWAAFYQLLVSLYPSEHMVTASLEDVLALLNEPQVEFLLSELVETAAAEDAAGQTAVRSFDLTLILQIVAAIIQLLKEQRNS